MTVCISAIADENEAIISCVDTKLSGGITSTELAVGQKMRSLWGWTVLGSGTTAYSQRFIERLKELLAKAPDNEPETIQEILESVRTMEIIKFCEDKYIGVDVRTLMKAVNDTELRRSILEYSEQYDVELIVSGWGDQQEKHLRQPGENANAHIFSVGRNGVLPHSHENFYICGSGSWAAHSILSFFNYESHLTLAQAVYYVAAAKFMSERSEGVGRNTIIRVNQRATEDPNKEWKGYFIQPSEIEEIRKIWEDSGAPRMTDDAEDMLVEIIGKHQKDQRTSSGHMGRTLVNLLKGKPVSGASMQSIAEKSEPEP